MICFNTIYIYIHINISILYSDINIYISYATCYYMVYLYIDILPICFLDISDALNTAGPKIQAALCDCRPSLPEPAGLPDTEQACCLGMLGRQLAVVLLCV
jgi:hypothetical protein